MTVPEPVSDNGSEGQFRYSDTMINESDERPPKKMERALTGGHVRHHLFVYN